MTKTEREERAKIRLATVKRLFARSLNRCAFPGCNSMIVDDESDAMLGEMCHIEGIGKKALRHNKMLTKEERDAYSNLILLCSNHHKVIDHDKSYTVESLRKMKAEHEKTGRMEIDPKDERFAKICIESMTARKTVSTSATTYTNAQHNEARDYARQTVINNFNVVKKVVKQKSYPDNAIGSDTNKANYISYLINKYHECKEWEIGKSGMNYKIFPSRVKNHFKIGANRTYNHIALCLFDDVVEFITSNIRRTKKYRVGCTNYRTYADWLQTQGIK